MDRMVELIKLLNYYAERYYTFDQPVVSDGEYDKLYDELKSLEEASGLILDNSPTVRVGGETIKAFKQYRHSHKLYSLDKCQSKDEFLRWAARTESALGHFPPLTVEYKFDGLTLNLIYEKGSLYAAATRGNGEVGEDVTKQVKTIKGVPLKIGYKGHIEVQGEGIMRLSVLEKYNAENKEPLKNARNGAAGAIRSLNPKVTASRNLDVMCYNAEGDIEFESQVGMKNFIAENMFSKADYFVLIDSAEQAFMQIDLVEKTRGELDFLIDGIVFKVNSTADRVKLGYTEKFPRWAVAYKFKAEEATTLLKDVRWQVSRTSKINPLALLEPVDLAGVTVKRATLNNIADIRKKDIKIGSKVFIRRSNDVIPEILGIAEHFVDSREIIPPSICPACGSPVTEDGAFIYCTNKVSCAPQIVAKLTHFAGKAAMDIEGLSDKTAEQLYNELGVKDFSDLYGLTADKLLGLEGFKQKKAENLLGAIEKSKSSTLARFIYALGVQNIGVKAAKQMAASFGTLERIKGATAEELTALDDFGLIMAKSVTDFFAEPDKLAQIDKLIQSGITFREEQSREGAFSGYNAVLTGSLEGYKRSEAQKLIEEEGGSVSSSVSKDVNLVIAGSEAGSKLDKAVKLGIKIIDEAAFKKMLNGGESND